MIIFYRFNTSLLNKSINFFQQKKERNNYWPQTFEFELHIFLAEKWIKNTDEFQNFLVFGPKTL